jgi:hypothetical protein
MLICVINIFIFLIIQNIHIKDIIICVSNILGFLNIIICVINIIICVINIITLIIILLGPTSGPKRNGSSRRTQEHWA